MYLDDSLVAGVSEEEHQANLEEVSRRLAEAGLRLKKNKRRFGVEAVDYLGHRITKMDWLPWTVGLERLFGHLHPLMSHK